VKESATKVEGSGAEERRSRLEGRYEDLRSQKDDDDRPRRAKDLGRARVEEWPDKRTFEGKTSQCSG